MINSVKSNGNAIATKYRKSIDSTRSVAKGGYYFVYPSIVRGSFDVYTLNGNPLGDFPEDIFKVHEALNHLKEL